MTPQELEEKAAEAFEDIVKAVKKGNCNLFLGAAVHAPPADTSTYTYPEPERPPTECGLCQPKVARRADRAFRFVDVIGRQAVKINVGTSFPANSRL